MEISYGRSHRVFHSINFQKIIEFVVVGVGIIIPIFFGYWRYETTSEANRVSDAIGCFIMSTPFSFGLWLSVTAIGRRIRYFSLLLVILGSLVHFIFQVYPTFLLPIVVVAEFYAVYSLFRKVVP